MIEPTSINVENEEKASLQEFKLLKPQIKERFTAYLDKDRVTENGKLAGRPREFNIDLFLDVFFQFVDNGCKTCYVKTYFPSIAGSYKRYSRLLVESKIPSDMNSEFLSQRRLANTLICDSFLVKSIDGSEELGKNPTDRGRNGVKVTFLCETSGIIPRHGVFPANTAENTTLTSLIEKPFDKRIRIIADSGFNGADMAAYCATRHIRLITKPSIIGPKKGYFQSFICANCKKGKKCTNGKLCINSKKRMDFTTRRYTHTLRSRDRQLLKKYRNRVELVNANIRRYRGINIKCVKRIATYRCLLDLAVLVHNHYYAKNPIKNPVVLRGWIKGIDL